MSITFCFLSCFKVLLFSKNGVMLFQPVSRDCLMWNVQLCFVVVLCLLVCLFVVFVVVLLYDYAC